MPSVYCRRRIRNVLVIVTVTVTVTVGRRSEVQKVTFSVVHDIEHGGKTNLLIEKRKMFDFGRIISLPNAANRAKI